MLNNEIWTDNRVLTGNIACYERAVQTHTHTHKHTHTHTIHEVTMHAMKVYRDRRCITPLILILGTRWR